MQKVYLLSTRKLILLTGIILFCTQISRAQAVYAPYSYQFYQKFNADVYAADSSFHTSLKPYLVTRTIVNQYNDLMNLGTDNDYESWVMRKLFNEHLFDVRTKEYTFYADYLPDNVIGKDFDDKAGKFTYTSLTPHQYFPTKSFHPFGVGITSRLGINTRGYQLGGTIGSKLSFYSSGFENQAAFPDYVTDEIKKTGQVIGSAYDRSFGSRVSDWSYVTAYVSYTPVKQLNITLGQDKTFIGDGYRSLFLSDYSAPSPFLRLTANIGPVQYMWMVEQLQDQKLNRYDTFGNNRRKWAAFHYFDWNVNKKLSLGFFNGLIAAEADDAGNRHGFDANYINPLLFASSLGSKTPYADNVLGGFTAKYKVLDKTALYAQYLIGSMLSADNSPKNANGYQIGLRGADLFAVNKLNYLFEYNTVKPYTYSAGQSISSYTNYSEPLAHPLGANFKEAIGILSYTIDRFDIQGQINYASYGLDTTATNFGKDLTKDYNSSVLTTSNTGQGLRTKLYYAEATVSYVINPKYNLRFELGALYRKEKNELYDNNTMMVTFGIRSSFRNLYHDF